MYLVNMVGVGANDRPFLSSCISCGVSVCSVWVHGCVCVCVCKCM